MRRQMPCTRSASRSGRSRGGLQTPPRRRPRDASSQAAAERLCPRCAALAMRENTTPGSSSAIESPAPDGSEDRHHAGLLERLPLSVARDPAFRENAQQIALDRAPPPSAKGVRLRSFRFFLLRRDGIALAHRRSCRQPVSVRCGSPDESDSAAAGGAISRIASNEAHVVAHQHFRAFRSGCARRRSP